MSLAWPLPALAAWAACWAIFLGLGGAGSGAAFVVAALAGCGLAATAATPWRRVFVGSGFPLSLAASGVATLDHAWAWLVPMALLAWAYPLRTWRDAPLFPTPSGALDGLAARIPLGRGARVLDAGCGLGAALIELRRQYPASRLEGLEWSWPLRFACALRCRFARVHRADLWAADWAPYELVYLFQRPESMARAVAKAERELAAGAWLVSLEFEAPSLVAAEVLTGADGRRVWLYRMPFHQPSD